MTFTPCRPIRCTPTEPKAIETICQRVHSRFRAFFHTLGNLTEARGEPGTFVTPTQEQLENAFTNYNTIPRYDQQWNE